jgi:hypothetical protein
MNGRRQTLSVERRFVAFNRVRWSGACHLIGSGRDGVLVDRLMNVNVAMCVRSPTVILAITPSVNCASSADTPSCISTAHICMHPSYVLLAGGACTLPRLWTVSVRWWRRMMEVVRHGNPARNESPAGPQAPKPAGDAADNKSRHLFRLPSSHVG